MKTSKNPAPVIAIILVLLAFCIPAQAGEPLEGLVAHWRFDEGSGTTAGDSSGNGYTGTFGGGPTWVTGRIGNYALQFDGDGDYVSIPDNDSLDITGDITIAAWVYFATGGSPEEVIVAKTLSNGARNNPFDFRTNGSAEPELRLVRADASGHEVVGSTEGISINQWHHVAVRVENKIPDFYIDGAVTAKSGTFTKDPTGNSRPLYIARRDDGLYFNGSIDDVRIYNRALSAEEIAAIYYAAIPNKPVIGLSPTEFEFTAVQGGANPADQILTIRNIGPNTLNWAVNEDCDWLSVNPTSGSSTGETDEVTLSADITGLGWGMYHCDIVISDPNSENGTETVGVTLHIRDNNNLHVPVEYRTIQAAINAAVDGDTIIVDPNTYVENINFLGKKIKVKSSNPNNWETVRNTIIDGSGNYGSCVVFNHGEDNSSVLEGFTLTGGTGTWVVKYQYANGYISGLTGGGIFCLNSSPVIRLCNIVKNGYYEWSRYPEVRYGGGIGLIGNCQATIENCFIVNNGAWVYGGGIIIRSNTLEQAASTIKNCTIANNRIDYPTDYRHKAYDVDCWDTRPNISNTIIYGNDDNIRSLLISDPALVTYCCVRDAYQFNINYNDSFPYDITSAGGNISEAPLFSNPFDPCSDYHLQADSPCINAGAPAYSPGAGEMDIDGQPRLMAGTVDIGADEVVPQITVDKPSAGDLWSCGSEHEIAWTSNSAGEVDIKFSSNAGSNWQVIESDLPDTGFYTWLVPDRADSNRCLISVVPSTPDANVVCTAGGPFTLQSYHPGPIPRGLGPQSQDGPQQFGPVKWQFQTSGPVSAAVTVDRNKVYIASEDGRLYTLNASGAYLWSYDTNSPLVSSPAVAPDGTVYIGAKDSKLYAINGRGRLLWTHATEAPIYSSSVVSPDGVIYTCSLDGSLYALAPDGSELWRFETGGFGGLPGSIFASPVIAADGTVYIAGLYDPNLYALNPADGSLRWVRNFDESLIDPEEPELGIRVGWPFASPAVAANGTIYQTLLFDPNLYALAPEDGDIIWKLNLSGEGSGWFDPNYADANIAVGGWSKPAVGPDGTIYVSFDDAYLRAVNPDGSLKWTSLLGTLGCFTLTVGSDGLIYAAGDGSRLYLVAPDGVLLDQFQGSGWLSFPTIAPRRTIIVSDANNIVWCIGQK